MLLFKPAIYLVLFVAASYAWKGNRGMGYADTFGATALRLVLGLVVGAFASLVLVELPASVAYPAFMAVRIGLWFFVARLFHQEVPTGSLLLFSVVGAIVSTTIDFLDTDGRGWMHELLTSGIC